MNKEKIIKFFKNPYNIAFLVLLIIAFIIRTKFLFQESMWVDEAAYMLSARRIGEGHFAAVFGYHTYVIVPVLLIFFFNIFFDLAVAGKLMALTFGILGIIFIYLIGKEIKDRATGLMAALLLTFNPLMWFHSSRVLTDSPLATMFILVAYALIKYEKKKKYFG